MTKEQFKKTILEQKKVLETLENMPDGFASSTIVMFLEKHPKIVKEVRVELSEVQGKDERR